jgi:hypothetical protein
MSFQARSSIFGAVLIAAGTLSAADTGKSNPTFSKDVAPILYKNCTTCHRPGEIAPMSLLSYKEARPWAKSIKEAVAGRVMPPWFADASYGHFANDTRLPQADVDTIVHWVDAGSPEGNPAEMPVAPKYVEGWVLGKPDVVIQMPESYDVPAEGVIPYKYFTADTNFTEDKWIRGVEIRPGNRAVVHHIILTLREAGGTEGQGGAGAGAQLAGTAPGLQPAFYREGVAKQIKAGSKIVFQMHYTPNGKATTDRSYVGLYFAKEPPREVAKGGAIINFNFKIPAGDSNYEVRSTWSAPEDLLLTGMTPHMHVRGKDFKFTAYYPDGSSEVLLNVPHYDFNWQLHYSLAKPQHMPKGTRIECVAHYDNSVNNRFNPNPKIEVHWGDQTFEEMMIGFFDYLPEKTAANPAVAALNR